MSKISQKNQPTGHKANPGQLQKNRRGINPARELTFIDLFAGIGGFRLAFEAAGARAVFTSEWDRFAKQSYAANFGEIPVGDIRQVDSQEIPAFDILCAGFPCQPFSLAGVSKKNALGRKHGLKDRGDGQLIFEIVRILQDHQPPAFILENVKNLISHDKGNTFKRVRSLLEKRCGYHLRFEVLSANPYVPQNRERLFIVGFRDPHHAELFDFPELKAPVKGAPKLRDILEKSPDRRYILSDHLWNYLQEYREKHRRSGNGFGFGLADLNGATRTLSARYYKDGSEILIPRRGQNPRRLTPRECARLMGFPDSFKIVVSDTQAYKQFGNSVVVPLVNQLATRLIATLNEKPSQLIATSVSA